MKKAKISKKEQKTVLIEDQQEQKKTVFSNLCCLICYNRFNNRDLIPKVFPCGHTMCLFCSDKIKDNGVNYKCPFDNLTFTSINTNYTVLKMLQEEVEMKNQIIKDIKDSLLLKQTELTVIENDIENIESIFDSKNFGQIPVKEHDKDISCKHINKFWMKGKHDCLVCLCSDKKVFKCLDCSEFYAKDYLVCLKCLIIRYSKVKCFCGKQLCLLLSKDQVHCSICSICFTEEKHQTKNIVGCNECEFFCCHSCYSVISKDGMILNYDEKQSSNLFGISQTKNSDINFFDFEDHIDNLPIKKVGVSEIDSYDIKNHMLVYKKHKDNNLYFSNILTNQTHRVKLFTIFIKIVDGKITSDLNSAKYNITFPADFQTFKIMDIDKQTVYISLLNYLHQDSKILITLNKFSGGTFQLQGNFYYDNFTLNKETLLLALKEDEINENYSQHSIRDEKDKEMKEITSLRSFGQAKEKLVVLINQTMIIHIDRDNYNSLVYKLKSEGKVVVMNQLLFAVVFDMSVEIYESIVFVYRSFDHPHPIINSVKLSDSELVLVDYDGFSLYDVLYGFMLKRVRFEGSGIDGIMQMKMEIDFSNVEFLSYKEGVFLVKSEKIYVLDKTFEVKNKFIFN